MDKRARVTSEVLTLHDPRRFGAIFKNNLLPVVVWHRDGRVRDANDAYLKLVGYSRQELRNGDLQCHHLTPSEHHVRDERAILDLLSGRKLCVVIEKDYVSRVRGRFPVVVGGTLLPDRQDEGIAFALDLTHYSSVEQALRRRKAPIADLCASVLGPGRVQERQQFELFEADTASFPGCLQTDTVLTHELRQPLSSILANAEAARRLLRQRPVNVDELKMIISDIISEDRRASHLIKRLRLNVLRKKSESQPLQQANDLLGHAIRAMRSEFALQGIRVVISLAAELPSIRGDRLQLHQLFINLFSNACEALKQSPASSKQLFIRSHLESGSQVAIDIQDTGPGIPAAQLESIFRPFVSGKPGGMGIGLYLCHSIARFHGGRLWATNHSEGGATFHIRLPAAAP